MKKNNDKGVTVKITAAVLCIIVLFGAGVRSFHYLLSRVQPEPPVHPSSEETALTAETRTSDTEAAANTGETVPVTYPSESLPDYQIHTTAPETTAPPETKPETTAGPSFEETLPDIEEPSSADAPDDTESAENTEESITQDSSSDYSEYSDNLPFVGTWTVEYDLGPAQAEALNARYSLPQIPDKPVILRISAVLSTEGGLRLIYRQEDADAFRTALNGWYSDASAIYAETGANTVQRAAFASWAAYRKGIYSLLSAETLSRIEAGWRGAPDKVFITDGDEVQAVLDVQFDDSEHITVTAFTVVNEDFRDTVSLMQSQLGFAAPYRLSRESR